MTNLHSALKTSVTASHNEGGINFLQVRLQNGKDSYLETLHARPNTFSTYGFQTTDFLSLIGFARSACAFHHGECFCRIAPSNLNLPSFSKAITESLSIFQAAVSHLEQCGIYVDQPEGWGYFYGKPPSGRRIHQSNARGNGHVAPTSKRMKEAEDDFFRFVFTWIEGAGDKGWTTHYRAKHMPLPDEFQLVLNFLGGFKWFSDCPEYEFEGCWWRFTEFQSRDNDMFDSNAEIAHRLFDAHATHFSAGIKGILEAHSILVPWGMTFLPPKQLNGGRSTERVSVPAITKMNASMLPVSGKQYEYDVAFSFAGTERKIAEEIATAVRDAGFTVFYDNFYPEQLWGQDLAARFDRIYRKESKYCVMFISQEYAARMWTTHERRSATARAIQERGNEYILPIKVEDVDIDGLVPTIGHISMAERTSAEITELLIKKMNAA